MKNRIDNIEELKANDILVTDGFLTEAECGAIQLLLDAHAWRPSQVAGLDEKNAVHEFISSARSSKTCFANDLNAALRKKIAGIEKRICRQFGLNAACLEGWQMTKYGYDECYEPHVDCIWEGKKFGVREKTILLYLLTPQKGGETFFRALNLYVKPLQGRLVIWNNLLPAGGCNHAMIHGGLPVKKGVKIILHTWLRYFNNQ